MNDPDYLQEVWSALDTVTDPEIDESVVSLEFVSNVQIHPGNQVEIEFRLPTYWCAPNFAYLMASDMRDVVSELDWVAGVTVTLLDHFSANLINRGIALRHDFRDAFPGETDDDLSAVRKKFLGQAYERRQELLMRYLFANGYSAEMITRMSLAELLDLKLDEKGISLRNLYLFARRKIRQRAGEHTPAFSTLAGTSIEVEQLRDYLRKIAGTRRNAEFNGAICRSLLSSRFKVQGSEFQVPSSRF